MSGLLSPWILHSLTIHSSYINPRNIHSLPIQTMLTSGLATGNAPVRMFSVYMKSYVLHGIFHNLWLCPSEITETLIFSQTVVISHECHKRSRSWWRLLTWFSQLNQIISRLYGDVYCQEHVLFTIWASVINECTYFVNQYYRWYLSDLNKTWWDGRCNVWWVAWSTR